MIRYSTGIRSKITFARENPGYFFFIGDDGMKSKRKKKCSSCIDSVARIPRAEYKDNNNNNNNSSRVCRQFRRRRAHIIVNVPRRGGVRLGACVCGDD